MMYWGNGWSSVGGLAMTVGMIAVALLVVLGVFLLIRPVFGSPEYSRREPDRDSVGRGPNRQGTGGLEVLDGRYARGEITREEYLERRSDLAPAIIGSEK